MVVQNLPANPSGLSPAWATVIAACIAVVAALIAFGGVWYAQRVTRATTKAQLRHQRAALIRQEAQNVAQLQEQSRQHQRTLSEQRKLQHAEFRAAERKQERADRLDALVEAAAALTDAASRVRFAHIAFKNDTYQDVSVSEIVAGMDRCSVAGVRLSLLGLENSVPAFGDANDSIRRAAYAASANSEEHPPEEAMEAMQEKIDEAVKIFREDAQGFR